MQLGIELDDFPESWKKRAQAGEPIGIPMGPAFSEYIEHWYPTDPGFAQQNLRTYIKAFKNTYDHLECYPEGKARAEKAFQDIGKKISRGLRERKQMGEKPPTCGPKCAACCTIRVTLTGSEADALVDYMRERDIKIDRDLVKLHSEKVKTDDDHIKLPWEKRVCPLLGEDKNCRVYDVRPLVCRKFMVASPPWMCDMRKSDSVAFIMDPATEGAVAAAMALERPADPSDHNLSNQLLKRISEDDRLWKQTAQTPE